MKRLRLLPALALLACAGAPADPAGPVVAEDPDGGNLAPDMSSAPATLPPTNADGERLFTLHHNAAPPPPVVLDMNRDEVTTLLGPVADQIQLLELDPYPLLLNSLEQIKTACGRDWQLDDKDPHLDCSLTPLGQSFAHDGMTAEESPEYALVRLLTMTPANCDVRGTSIEFLQGVSDWLGIGGGFGQMLADNLEIDRTEEFLDTRVVAESLRNNFVATHPNIGPNGGIPFTLADALSDLATLAVKLGPTRGHPGIMAPGFVAHGIVFGPDFRMKVSADSNIHIFDGLSLAQGQGQLNVLDDRVGPNFDDPLEFNFVDPTRFTVSGLIDNPTADLRIGILENDLFIPACAGPPECQGNLPGNPVGENSVWSQPAWQLEPIVGQAGVYKYTGLVHHTDYVGGLASVEIGENGNEPAWIHFGVPFDLGPKDQYAWELILEVAEVGMHGPDMSRHPEGDADVAFTLHDVPVGITGQQCADAVRPYLDAQKSEIAQDILGDFRSRNDAVDFYLSKIEAGQLALYFVAPTDLPPGAAYPWHHPGFYLSPTLEPAQKVSILSMGGSSDQIHEKLLVTPDEQIVYTGDAKGTVYRLRISPDPLDATAVRVFVKPVQP